MIRTRLFRARVRKRDSGPYHVLNVNVADRHTVEITVSPTGRTWHLYVDGKRIEVKA